MAAAIHIEQHNKKKITMTAVRSIIFLFSLSFSPFFQENENDYFTISRPLTGNEEEDLKKMATVFQLVWLDLFIKKSLR